MTVRPPPEDDAGDETSIEFGIAQVDQHLGGADLDFPASPEDVADALADPDVDYDASGNAVALSEALDATGRAEFQSRADLLNALHPVFEEYRTTSGPGVLAWVRSLLPL